MTDTKPPLMTAEDISNEIFGNNRSARTISEKDAMHPDYPKAKRLATGGKTGKKYFNRDEIMGYYNLKKVA